MPTVLLTQRFPDPVMEELRKRFTVVGPLSERHALIQAIPLADALAVTLAEQVDAELLSHASRLKIVAVYAVGYNNVDLAAAGARGIVVTNTPDVLTETTADLTWGLILAVARRIPEGERLLRQGRWEGWAPTHHLGTDVYGNEPRIHPELLKLENVVLAPHIGSATYETRVKMGMVVVENIAAALSGREPSTPVRVG